MFLYYWVFEEGTANSQIPAIQYLLELATLPNMEKQEEGTAILEHHFIFTIKCVEWHTKRKWNVKVSMTD